MSLAKHIPRVAGLALALAAVYRAVLGDVQGALALAGVASGFLGLGEAVDKYVVQAPGSAQGVIVAVYGDDKEAVDRVVSKLANGRAM